MRHHKMIICNFWYIFHFLRLFNNLWKQPNSQFTMFLRIYVKKTSNFGKFWWICNYYRNWKIDENCVFIRWWYGPFKFFFQTHRGYCFQKRLDDKIWIFTYTPLNFLKFLQYHMSFMIFYKFYRNLKTKPFGILIIYLWKNPVWT